jgi:hypothetical protein
MNADLFGNEIYKPTVRTNSPTNAALGFVEFWKAWPPGPRKVAKQQCLNKWAKQGCAEHAALICRHVETMKTAQDWLSGFVPMPLTYLNQRRWEGTFNVEIDPDSKQAIEALAAANGIAKWDELREQWTEYRARIKKTCAPRLN